MNLANCKVSKQPNGNSLFIIFQGSEQAILDAYNTLWQVNCFSGDLDWLNPGEAVISTSVEQAKRGLFYREYLKLIAGDKPDHCKARAQELATKAWESMESVRVVTPTVFQPWIYKVVGNKDRVEWQCEKTDLVED